MTDKHPLTDEMCFSIYIKSTYRPGKWGYMEAMRDTADWQLEQCIAWLDDTDCDDPQETAQRLREAMRPTTTQEDN